jgi:hypothetical protein
MLRACVAKSRRSDKACRAASGTERQRVVGSVAKLTYEAALVLVQQEIESGLKGVGSNTHYSVRQACEDYIQNKLTPTGPKAAQNARNTLAPFVLATPLPTGNCASYATTSLPASTRLTRTNACRPRRRGRD